MPASRDEAVQDLTVRGGCLAKLPGSPLRQLLKQLKSDSNAWQDASFVKVGPVRLLSTIDFGPLACADPCTAGRLAALNAFSDIYASGGVPLSALVMLVIDPSRPVSVAEQLLAGIAAASEEEGVSIVGGQTITGSECLAGLSVIGTPRGAVIFRKQGGAPGDHLFLSKPVGTGLATWAHALGAAGDDVQRAAVEVMLVSNARASIAALDAAAHAVTDVTGFGLLGHLSEMLHAGLGATIELDRVPLLAGVRELPSAVCSTSAIGANTAYVRDAIALHSTRSEWELAPLFDAQTNGGLLAAVSPGSAASLEFAGFTRIGTLTGDGTITVA